MEYLLYFVGVASRLIPHAANLTPVGAIGIFATKKFGAAKAAILIMAIMLTSDIFLGFSRISLFVYLGFFGYILASRLIRKNILGYLAAPITGGLFFFIISNFGVWLGPWYNHTSTGLAECFSAAFPFYRNTLIGDVCFTIALFSLSSIYDKIKAKYKEERWAQKLQPTSLTKRS